MANVDNPYGFRPWGPVLSLKRFVKLASYATRVFRHDLVAFEGTGGGVNVAAAGSVNMVGSAAFGSLASVAADLMVYDDPQQKLEAQDDGVGAITSAQANVGEMVDHLATTGSTVTGISAHEIDISTAATTTSGFLLLDLVNRPDNAWGANADIVVAFNEHLRMYESSGGRAGV